MRPRVTGRFVLGTNQWCWLVVNGQGLLDRIFWTWEAALDHAIELVLDSQHKNHLHLWN